MAIGRMASHGSDNATSAIADENALISRIRLTRRRLILSCRRAVGSGRLVRSQPALANRSKICCAAAPSPPSSGSKSPSSARAQLSKLSAKAAQSESKNGQAR
jgi:hypothetical protein